MAIEVSEILERYNDSYSFYSEERDECVDDIRLAYIGDTPESSNGVFRLPTENAGPKYRINKLIHPLNQVNGRFNQNKISGKIIPTTDSGKKEIAESMTGLMRNIEKVSKADQIYSDSFLHIASGGFSAWSMQNVFSDDDTFEQDLRIVSIPDPFYSVWGDPSSRRFDTKDWEYGLVTRDISKRAFRKKYPDAAFSDFPQSFTNHGSRRMAWATDATVRIAEYWEVEFKKRKIFLMSNGEVYKEDKLKLVRDELAAEGITVVKERKIEDKIVKSYISSGLEILEGPFIWPGSWIPIIPVYGYKFFLDNEFHYHGKVRFARDSQRLYEYITSSLVETIVQVPRDPYWVSEVQAEGFEDQYSTFNTKKPPFMYYKNDPENPGPPSRTGAPAVQSALIQQLQQADFDIQATMGEFRASLGIPEGDQSGTAINQLQQQSDAGSFDLVNSMANAIEFTWETGLDVIAKIYDSQRQVRILDSEDKEEVIEINKTVIDTQTGEAVILNDLSVGKYDVTITVGPASKTQRQEHFQLIRSIIEFDPALAAISSDVWLELIDSPKVDKLVKRWRKIKIAEGVIEPNDEEKEEIAKEQANTPPDPNAEIQQQTLMEQLRGLALSNEKAAAEIQESVKKAEKTQAEVGKILAETLETYSETGASIRPEDLLLRSQQNENMLQQQNSQDAGIQDPAASPNSVEPPPVDPAQIVQEPPPAI